jgi:uncharacterized protein (TIGR01777 family)
MRVLISGATGLVGKALSRSLAGDGHEALRLTRRDPEGPSDIPWDPEAGVVDLSAAGALDAVVHLAGENIAAGRWSDDRKARIRDSRVDGTAVLAEAVGALPSAPRAFVSASAVGYYGDRGDEKLTENSPPGSGFLPDTCVAWEAAAGAAAVGGARIVHVRIGLVLSAEGGALARMRLPFLLGLGGRLGSGDQFMSWIAIQDLVRVFRLAIERDTLSGPVNAVAPAPATNREFTRALGRVLHRPAVLPVPSPALRLLLGEMADALLLSSTRAIPKRLEEAGFRFEFPDLTAALSAQLSS